MKASMIRSVPDVDPPASFGVRAVEAIKTCVGAKPLHGGADIVSLLPSPEAIIQDDIYTEREAAHPQWFEQLQDGFGSLGEALFRRIVSEQAGHPLVGREPNRIVLYLQLLGEGGFP